MRTRITFEVKEARGLIYHGKKTCNPYFCVTVGQKKKKSRVLKKTLDPLWDEQISISADLEGEKEITIGIFGHEIFSHDAKLGLFRIQAEDISFQTYTNPKWHKLSESEGGEIFFSVKAEGLHAITVDPSFSPAFSEASSESSSSTPTNELSRSRSGSGVSEISNTLGVIPRKHSGIFSTPEGNRKFISKGSARSLECVEFFNGENIIMENVLNHNFGCSLRGSGGGTMTINESQINFTSKKKEELTIRFEEVTQFIKSHVAIVVPNAIEIHTETRGIFSFFGFAQRDIVLKVLQQLKSSQVKLTEQNGETALFTAVMANELNEVKRILSSGITSSEINIQDKFGFSVLHLAVSKSDINVGILFALLEFDGIRVDLKNQDQNTPLHYFCQKFKTPDECPDLFHKFVKKGADVNAQNRVGETPLHKAIFNNQIRLILVDLLFEAGAQVDLLNSHGETALHYAARLGRKDLVNVLVTKGADVNIRGKEKEKETAYELAIRWGYEDMAEHLKKIELLSNWLKELGMEKYFTLFVQEEMFLEECESIDDSVLDRLGITVSGQRLKMSKAVLDLKLKRATPKFGLNVPVIVNSPSESYELSNNSKKVTKKPSLFLQQAISELSSQNSEGEGWIDHSDLEFTKKLGSGTSGKVYQGLFKGKEVAIKVLKDIESSESMEEFKKEFLIMRAMNSPQVVQLHGACLEPKLSMVMELCSRGSLYHVLSDRSIKMDWLMYFRIMIEVIAGIRFLHASEPQILHRDVKSLNYLVNREWKVKVCDFGLSRMNTTNNINTLNKICGTVTYLAPEVYQGEKFTDKSDVFSLGIVLWEITNRVLKGKYDSPYSEFKFQFDWQILLAVTQNDQRPTLPLNTPQVIIDLIKPCLELDQSKRPTAQVLHDQIHEAYLIFKENRVEWDKLLEESLANQLDSSIKSAQKSADDTFVPL
eukprot:TRINITY_DN4691_c0_g1_i3.p1 TRINITY_DN4691_c0_g1~~TRINITY_DN4691_c0_g1_i3.p1  ORF type:complete len:937 (-),score=335.21 TRINITY_DN4691_c0_g1_i3:142-2952(-)